MNLNLKGTSVDITLSWPCILRLKLSVWWNNFLPVVRVNIPSEEETELQTSLTDSHVVLFHFLGYIRAAPINVRILWLVIFEGDQDLMYALNSTSKLLTNNLFYLCHYGCSANPPSGNFLCPEYVLKKFWLK